MKKHLCYLLALMLTLSASCSKDPAELDFSDSAQGGNHRLTELSASLDDDETRTSLQTSNNNVVYWSTKDRILVVNTTTYDSWYYELVSGVGTSVGKFEPLGEAATCNDDLSNIVAVYPAVAAVVDKAAKTLSFTVNNDWNKTDEGKKKLLDCNIRSWNNDSPTNFSHNDIKVSYHVNGTANNANFKFRQLGTWCVFSFDFTADESVRKESLQSIEVTTTEGDVQISGTRQVDLSDPNQPTLIAKNASELIEADKSVAWTFNTASNLTTSFTRSMMLFSGLENRQLKITAETNLHTFVFYAKPQTKLEAGTVLRFPIGFKQNFNTEIQPDDDPLKYAMAYTAAEKELYPFYYYGNANCYLIAGTGNNSCTVDVTRHKASPYYEKNDAEATEAKRAAYAKVIWYETAMGEPSINGQGAKAAITGNEFTVTLADATKFGNALIGIYESETSDTPLWSYHIWHPEDDPEQTLRYEYTFSGAYDVMPIMLGATAKATVTPTGTATNETNAKALGFYYQWGRKDPLGRPNSITASGGEFVATTDGDGQVFNFRDAANEPNLVTLLGGENINEKDGKLVDRWMIDYVTANPTQFIMMAPRGTYNNNWTAIMNSYLWGNPQGYNYPMMGNTYKSVFDPCPEGYRVAPKDLWIAFTKSGAGSTIDVTKEETWAGTIFNVLNLSADRKTTTTRTQCGYHFCYGVNEDGSRKWQQEPTDFYPNIGRRESQSGAIASVGVGGWYWCSSPAAKSSEYAGRMGVTDIIFDILATDGSARGMGVRCVAEPNR